MLFLGVVLKRAWAGSMTTLSIRRRHWCLTSPCRRCCFWVFCTPTSGLPCSPRCWRILSRRPCSALPWRGAGQSGAARGKIAASTPRGAFRGNNGVIGLAPAASMYGDYGISLGAVLAGLVILLYNTLSTIVLAVYSPVIKSDPWSICKSVVKNPLIISVLAAVPLRCSRSACLAGCRHRVSIWRR